MGSGRLTYEQMTDDLNALLDQLNLKSVNVLGWSDGGIIGLLMAIKYPDKVSRLAIMGANLQPSGAYGWAQEWANKQNELIEEMIARGDTSVPWAHYKLLLDLIVTHMKSGVENLHSICFDEITHTTTEGWNCMHCNPIHREALIGGR